MASKRAKVKKPEAKAPAKKPRPSRPGPDPPPPGGFVKRPRVVIPDEAKTWKPYGANDLTTGRRRCIATNRRGIRCNMAPIQGATVCRIHGGSAPQVREAAERRIARLAEGPAVDALEKALKSRNWGAVLTAARDLLDRAGIGKKVPGYTLEQVLAILRQYTEVVMAALGQAERGQLPVPEVRGVIARGLRERLGSTGAVIDVTPESAGEGTDVTG